jgi:sigma-B regulation protein RsbU (phosphoserine phosphatase)
MGDRRPATVRRSWDPNGDLLVLFTDGVSDARNRAGDRFGEARIHEVVKIHRAKEPHLILESVFEVLEQYVGRAPQRDDLTMVLLKT